jgi:putative phosphoesterase
MKYFICSDIHGSAAACGKALSFFSRMNCDFLVLLGDILYHGPRNPLPEGYDPKEVAGMLNPLAEKVIACRGNCDAEVDQMVLNFPLLSDYTLVVDEGVRLFCTHGHIYSPLRAGGESAVAGSRQPTTGKNSVVLYGHTHIQVLEKNETGALVCNPGSVSLPKSGSRAGFAVYEGRRMALFSMSGTELGTMTL